MKEKSEKCALDMLIIALCADYPRRRRILLEGGGEKRQRYEFAYLNRRIYHAAAEIVGSYYAETFIYDIANRVDYVNSRAKNLSESTYKIYKKEVKINISKKLYLNS